MKIVTLYDAEIFYRRGGGDNVPFDQSLTSICTLTDMVECRVTEELNGVYELGMVYVVTGYNASEIQTDRIIGVNVPLRNSLGENYFRIYKIEKDLTGRMYVYARHLAADLSYMAVFNDLNLSGVITNFSTWAAHIRACAMGSFPFVFQNDGAIPSGFRYTLPCKTPVSVMQYIGGDNLMDPDKTMLDLFGGEIVWDKFEMWRCNERGQDRETSVAYGANMENIAIDDDLDGVYTSFVLYYRDDQFQVASWPHYTEYYPLFPYTRTMIVDWTFFLADMEDKTEARIKDALDAAATTYAANHSELGNPIRKIEASLVEENVRDLYLGDRIGVVYNRHGESINARMKVVAYEWDVIMQRYTSLTLGAIKDTLAKVIAETFTAQDAGADLATITQRVSSLESTKVGIERVGSGMNVGYKFSDGTLICTKTAILNVNITTAWGSVFYNGTLASMGDWPVPFISKPVANYSQNGSNDVLGISAHDISATSAGGLYLYKPLSATNQSIEVGAIAVGRWK